MIKKERADTLLPRLHLAETQREAQVLIMAGLVDSAGRRVEKPGQLLDPTRPVTVRQTMPFVSRGGLKLEGALAAFAIDVRGLVAADLGASTGGFTDCLLQRGARLVYAVDVSADQLDWRLRNDARVRPIEKNARHLRPEDFPVPPEIVVMDLSFISVLKVLPAVRAFLGPGRVVSLLKPQFEAGRDEVGKRGVIRDPARHEAVLIRLLEDARALGFQMLDLTKSSTRGQKGNQEFLVHWRLAEHAGTSGEIITRVREVVYE